MEQANTSLISFVITIGKDRVPSSAGWDEADEWMLMPPVKAGLLPTV